MRIQKFTFLLTFLTCSHICVGQSLASLLYCSIFGNQDVQPEYKELVVKALKELGVQNPESVPVKQMNGVGPAFARIDLSSFTAFGIWLDEAYLDNCSQEEKLFHIYHETSHYACKHHQKILLGSAASVGIVAFAFTKLYNALSEQSKLVKYGMLATSALATIAGSYLYLLPNIVKKQEKEADISAAKALIQIGHDRVVDARIDQLKAVENHAEGGIWWPSNDQQIQYLEAARSL